jgi:membrane carboxypeptidase/penicillin-binding protein
MTSMLASVVENGTAASTRALGLSVPAAGKTGTTDDYTDAWFVGFVPNLSTGVWVGFDRKQKIGPGMTGAAAALPIWVDVMVAATKGKAPQEFPMPSGVMSVLICTSTGLLANPACPETELELFHEGVQPSSFCNIHTGDAPATESLDLHETDSEAPPEERLRL